MRFRFLAGAVLSLSASLASGEVITPTHAVATSEFGAVDVFNDGNFSSVFVGNLIDGSGLDGAGDVLGQTHDFDGMGSTMWHAGCFDAGIPGGVPATCSDPDMLLVEPVVDEQIVEFLLGDLYDLNTAHIWQMNQGGLFGALAPERGVDEFKILVSPSETGDDFTSVGSFNLDVEAGTEMINAQVIDLGVVEDVRRVRFDISTRFGTDADLSIGFVGLSEVRFEGSLATSDFVADFDKDGDVDGDDFLIWQSNFGTSEGATSNTGDADGDGDVDGDDFLAWQTEFSPGGNGGSTRVPEPTAAALAGLATGIAATARRRRR